MKPLLAIVADGTAAGAEVREAARLLGTVLAKRPAIADFLVGEGALPAVANLVATGAQCGTGYRVRRGGQNRMFYRVRGPEPDIL